MYSGLPFTGFTAPVYALIGLVMIVVGAAVKRLGRDVA